MHKLSGLDKNSLWKDILNDIYKSPISDGEREKFFRVTLKNFFVSKHTIKRGLNFLDEIKTGRSRLKEVNQKESYDKVVIELNERFKEYNEELNERVVVFEKSLNRNNFLPSFIPREVPLFCGWVSLTRSNSFEEEEDKTPTHSWGSPVFSDERNGYDIRFNSPYKKKQEAKYSYDERLDIEGSLSYAIDVILKGSHDHGFGGMDSRVSDAVKAITSALKKYRKFKSDPSYRYHASIFRMPTFSDYK